MDAWKLGLKAVAIYRDNCKVGQPLSMAKKAPGENDASSNVSVGAPTASVGIVASIQSVVDAIAPGNAPQNAVRHQLQTVRNSKTFKFTVGGVRGYFTVGEYNDGTPGELFVSMAKMGSTLRGVMDAFATSVSYGLQYGVPLKKFVRTFSSASFAPAGITDDPDIRTASSLIDYIFRRMALTYLSFDDRLELGMASLDDMPADQTSLLGDTVAAIMDEAKEQVENVLEALPLSEEPVRTAAASTAPSLHFSQNTAPEPKANKVEPVQDAAAPLCYNCGNQTQRAGSCYVCGSCGSTTGCS